MVNTAPGTKRLPTIRLLVGVYLLVAVATLVALAVLSTTAPAQAPREAWVHAIVVMVFAVLLPVRLRSAERGSASALRAVGVIASVLIVANVVEASIPGFAPIWMRIEMVALAVLLAVLVGVVFRERSPGR